MEDTRQRAIRDGAMDAGSMLGVPLPDDGEDISQYKFSKYAATYFQSNASHTYIRRAIKIPLLSLKNEGDQLVSERRI